MCFLWITYNLSVSAYVWLVGGGNKKKKVKKAKATGGEKAGGDKQSLLVTALKRLLPVGLNLFAGKEQEIVQHCKDRSDTVSFLHTMTVQ